ncbi:MAG: hypothetical protein ABW224_14795 [Kibdelosporangium sp.]
MQGTAGNGAVARLVQAGAPISIAEPTTPEFLGLVTDIEAQRAAVLARSTQRAEQAHAEAESLKQRFRQTAEAKALEVEQAHADGVGSVRQNANDARATIQSNVEAECTGVDAAAEAEFGRLDQVITDKRETVARQAGEKAAAAEQTGTEQAQRAEQGTTERSARATDLADAKITRYRDHEKTSEISETVATAQRDVIAELTRTGAAVAESVRAKSRDLGGHFRDEAAETARDFDRPRGDARAQIVENRDQTKQTLRSIATNAINRITAEANRLAEGLQTESARRSAEIRDQVPAFDASIDESVANSVTHAAAEALAADLAGFAEQSQDAACYPPFADEARTELIGAVAEREAELDEQSIRLSAGLQQTTSDAEAGILDHAQTLTAGVQQLVGDSGTTISGIVDSTATEMHSAADQGAASMAVVTTEVAGSLDESIADLNRRWDERLTEHTAELRGEVDEALASEDRAVDRFSGEIDTSVDRIIEDGFFASAFNFIAGLAEGIWNGAVGLLKGIWDAIKTPLFWIAVAVVVVVLVIAVVVLVIKGAAVLAAIGLVLAFAGKVLLVIGVIAGAIAVGYYVYLAITRPDLTWRQRGELVGRAVFEGVMALAGTGILARLRVFAQVSRFRALVAEAGGLGIAIRLVNKVPNLEKIAELLRLAEAGNVLRVLDKINDVDTAILLLGKMRDVDQLLLLVDKINDAGKAARLAELIEQVPDVQKLGRLLDRVRDPDDLIRMIGELGGPDGVLRLTDDLPAADLAALVTTHGADAVRWAGAEMTGAQAQTLLARMSPDVLAAMRGPTGVGARAAEQLLDTFSDGLLARMVSEVELRELATLLGQQEAGAARQMVEQWVNAGKPVSWERLRKFLRGAGQAAETEGFAAVGAGDIIVDNQTLSTVRAMVAGIDYSALQNIEKRMIEELFRHLGQPLDSTGTFVPPDQAALQAIMPRLRAPATVMGETGVNALHKPPGGPVVDLGPTARPSGLAVEIDRNSAAYRDVLDALEQPPARPWTAPSGIDPVTGATEAVGLADGIRDRTVVADALFAQVTGGGVPRFMTADGGVFERLAAWSHNVRPPGPPPGKIPARLARANPGGFEIIINGRTLHVLPVGL